MADIKWIKLSVEMFDDEKIKLLESLPEGDTLIVIWCKLLTMAGKGNHSGYIMLTEQFAYNDDMLVTVINRPAATVKLALHTFQQFGMLEFDADKQAYSLSNWEKHQSLNGMEKVREQARLRKQKERERKKTLQLGTPMSRDSHEEVTPSHATELELELELEPIKDIVERNSTLHHQVIEYLCKVTGKKFSSSSGANKRLINGRVTDGYKFEDFKRVIDVKVSEWKDDPNMSKYLRPATLFNASKFEAYLNEEPASKVINESHPTDEEDVLEKLRKQFGG